MPKRTPALVTIGLLVLLASTLVYWGRLKTDDLDVTEKNEMEHSLWRKKLTPLQYRVTRQKGTERAFSGEYWDHKEDGTYLCVCCRKPLFDSQTKFKSGTGWPSFFDIIDAGNVKETEDDSLRMPFLGTVQRTEVTCSQCDAHLGHVFPDGPAPTGMRYCVNSAALDFEKRKDEDIEKREPE